MIVGCWNSIENFAKETSLWQCVEGLKVDTSWVLKLLFCITYSMGVSAYRVIEKLDANVIRIMSKEWGLRDIWVQHRWLHRGECLLSSGIVALKKKKGYLIGNVLFSFVLGSRHGYHRWCCILEVTQDSYSFTTFNQFCISSEQWEFLLHFPPYNPDIMPIKLLFS